MQNINFFESPISVDVQVHDSNQFVICYQGKTLCSGTKESCMSKIRQIIYDLDKITTTEESVSHSKKTVIFKIQNYGMSGQTDVICKNIDDFKSSLFMLRNSVKCDIEVKTPFHGFV